MLHQNSYQTLILSDLYLERAYIMMVNQVNTLQHTSTKKIVLCKQQQPKGQHSQVNGLSFSCWPLLVTKGSATTLTGVSQLMKITVSSPRQVRVPFFSIPKVILPGKMLELSYYSFFWLQIYHFNFFKMNMLWSTLKIALFL